ncbi:CORVET complex membrane-binding subunit VPS8 SCDLUD_001513 [Saccharomycodes ludwigii]|nr:hypothetical protein SCDLUD_001513 [Saccharomycodes ludwigii]KAH3901740.1 hypothetical protein SCDLUD_001513 [Saccharomycodes ludwigii]
MFDISFKSNWEDKYLLKQDDTDSEQQSCQANSNHLLSMDNDEQYSLPITTKWVDLAKVYENMYGILEFPPPTTIFTSSRCIALGTSKGHVLIYNYSQFITHVLVPEDQEFRSPITMINLSHDGTYLAAACKSGDIFLWDLNRPPEPTSREESFEKILSILHIVEHRNSEILSLEFLSNKHTGIVVSDNKFRMLYHKGFRNGLWKLKYTTAEIPTESQNLGNDRILVTKALPFPYKIRGECIEDIVAILDLNSVKILSFKKANLILFYKTFDTPMRSVGDLLWNIEDDGGKSLYVSRDSSVYLFKFAVDETSLGSGFTLKSTKKFEHAECVEKLSLINKYMVSLLTSSGKIELLDMYLCDPAKIASRIDIAKFYLLQPLKLCVSSINSQIALLTNSSLKMAKFNTWSETILSCLQQGNMSMALQILMELSSENCTSFRMILKLDNDPRIIKKELNRTFESLSLAIIDHLSKQDINDSDRSHSTAQLDKIFGEIIEIDSKLNPREMPIIEHLTEKELSDEMETVFLSKLVTFLEHGSLNKVFLPPLTVKKIINYYVGGMNTKDTNLAHILSCLVFKLDPVCYDIDQLIKCLNKIGAWDLILYFWPNVFNDFVSPFIELLSELVSPRGTFFKGASHEELQYLLFQYLYYSLSGLRFPNSQTLTEEEATTVKTALYGVIFNGSTIRWPQASNEKLCVFSKDYGEHEPAYPYFKFLLQLDPLKCLALLNCLFEDSYFNGMDSSEFGTTESRQTIIDILLGIVNSSEDLDENIAKLISVFISTNYPKYQQFIRISTRNCHVLIKNLCKNNIYKQDSELGVECLLSMKKVHFDLEKYIPIFSEKGFTRVLFSIYRSEHKYVNCLKLYFQLDSPNVFGVHLIPLLEEAFLYLNTDPIEKQLLIDSLLVNFAKCISVNASQFAVVLCKYCPSACAHITKTLEPISDDDKIKFLRKVLEYEGVSIISNKLLSLYIQSLCKDSKYEKELNVVLSSMDLKTTDIKELFDILKEHQKYTCLFDVMFKLHFYPKIIDESEICFKDYFGDEKSCSTLSKDILERLYSRGLAACIEACSMELWSRFLLIFFSAYHMLGVTDICTEEKRNFCMEAIQQIILTLSLNGENETIDKGTEQITEGVLDKKNLMLTSVLTKVLENSEFILSKISKVRPILQSIFINYTIEQISAQLILRIFNSDSKILTDNYQRYSLKGWMLLNRECFACGEVLYGPDIDREVIINWLKTEGQKLTAKDEILQSEDLDLIVFHCLHGFHKQCLKKLGQNNGKYKCLQCIP